MERSTNGIKTRFIIKNARPENLALGILRDAYSCRIGSRSFDSVGERAKLRRRNIILSGIPWCFFQRFESCIAIFPLCMLEKESSDYKASDRAPDKVSHKPGIIVSEGSSGLSGGGPPVFSKTSFNASKSCHKAAYEDWLFVRVYPDCKGITLI